MTAKLRQIQAQAKAGRPPDNVTKIVVDNASEQISAVETGLSKNSLSNGASELGRVLKALKSLAKENKYSWLWKRYKRNNDILMLH